MQEVAGGSWCCCPERRAWKKVILVQQTYLAAKQIVLVCRLDAPWGTADKPVEVTSAFSERIVGVPDPYDDSIVWRAHNSQLCHVVWVRPCLTWLRLYRVCSS